MRAGPSTSPLPPFLEPSAALPERTADGRVLPEAQVAAWREQGFALVHGVLPLALVQRARQEAEEAFPAPGAVEARYGPLGMDLTPYRQT